MGRGWEAGSGLHLHWTRTLMVTAAPLENAVFGQNQDSEVPTSWASLNIPKTIGGFKVGLYLGEERCHPPPNTHTHTHTQL